MPMNGNDQSDTSGQREQNQQDGQHAVSPSAAVYAFAAWITCRNQPVTFSARHDAAPAAALVGEFCDSQGFPDPPEGWEKQLRPYPPTL